MYYSEGFQKIKFDCLQAEKFRAKKLTKYILYKRCLKFNYKKLI